LVIVVVAVVDVSGGVLFGGVCLLFVVKFIYVGIIINNTIS
jgi:hypothetical protein